jgi:hypothetical protein
MKAKQLGILAAVAAVLVAIAVSQKKQEYNQPRPSEEETLVFHDLDVNAITHIAFQTGGKTLLLTVNDDDEWVVGSKYSYPINFEKLRSFLIKIHDLKKGSAILASDDQLAELKLLAPETTGPANMADAGTLISFKNESGETLATLLVGKAFEKVPAPGQPQMPMGMPNTAGNYVKTTDGQVYVVSSSLNEANNTPIDWLDKELINLPSHKIEEIKVTGPDRTDVHIKKTTLHELMDIPEGYEADTAAVSSLTGAFSYLNFTDLADPEGSDDDYGFSNPVKFEVTTFDKQVVTVLIGAVDEESQDRYIRMSIKMRDLQDDEAESDKEALAKTAAETARLNKRLEGWTFIIPSYKSDSMLKKKEDLIKKTETPETKEDADAEDSK